MTMIAAGRQARILGLPGSLRRDPYSLLFCEACSRRWLRSRSGGFAALLCLLCPGPSPGVQATLTTKCLVTGSIIFQVPLKLASTTKASPGPTSTGAPPSGVMMMRPAIMCTNS